LIIAKSTQYKASKRWRIFW